MRYTAFLMILTMLVFAGCAWQISVYNECRAKGDSTGYCLFLVTRR